MSRALLTAPVIARQGPARAMVMRRIDRPAPSSNPNQINGDWTLINAGLQYNSISIAPRRGRVWFIAQTARAPRTTRYDNVLQNDT